MEQTDARAEPLVNVAEDLLAAKVKSIEEVGGGRNSRVYRIVAAPSHVYALKSYFQHESDKRRRLHTEFSSFRFLWESGIRNVPKPVAASPEHNVAIYEWIDGQRMGPAAVSDAAINAATSFLTKLQSLRGQHGSGSFEAASEACFSGGALVENVESRLQPFLPRDDYGDLTEFLSRDFVPAFTRIVEWSRERAGKEFDTELPEGSRILSPSDFGFHNALCCEKGQIHFLDFEYFGWDDPAKTIADFLLHPAMPLTHHDRRQFARGALKAFSFDPKLAGRVRAYYPLFGLKWCLILLNEFRPDQLLRRQFAATEYQSSIRQNEQLTKAKAMLHRLLSEYDNLPYLN